MKSRWLCVELRPIINFRITHSKVRLSKRHIWNLAVHYKSKSLAMSCLQYPISYSVSVALSVWEGVFFTDRSWMIAYHAGHRLGWQELSGVINGSLIRNRYSLVIGIHPVLRDGDISTRRIHSNIKLPPYLNKIASIKCTQSLFHYVCLPANIFATFTYIKRPNWRLPCVPHASEVNLQNMVCALSWLLWLCPSHKTQDKAQTVRIINGVYCLAFLRRILASDACSENDIEACN